MKPLFRCEIHYFPSPHLSQIYDGFEKLRGLGLLKISIKPTPGNKTIPLLTVIINDKHKIIYDTLDGLNWISGSIEENLIHFKKSVVADFYFKRSYQKQLVEYSPNNCFVYPLGFNYNVKSADRFSFNLKERLMGLIKASPIISKHFNLRSSSRPSGDFEFYPLPNKRSEILFLAKIWGPNVKYSESFNIEIEKINNFRINCIKVCKKEFGELFLGGLQRDRYSLAVAKDLVVPLHITEKKTFINTIKDHNICIATTGLHDSIGWKVGEYVAASRAIVSEPLKYEVPGDFEMGKNYLAFNNEDELLEKISILLNDREKLFELMNNNFHYYNNYLRPEILVLNTLLKVYQHILE
ncbi:MAG: hypothetical protein OQJ93_00480 [Ignavibacteriaceae bacterium]|nr:hypothetical protein [Ignavibacteriaceae bacterium]MCW8994559.1 hypothetical protein [Psychromonas sp.]MCW8818672.1 hypothetical protein [Ignavibacteriaceae bacterium]MCW8823026.1 hypothetical protein [Ignavibacteriaceae bacterium]MCW8961439.1 hypothetical protein [Ignavibacteriaceae bacterium]